MIYGPNKWTHKLKELRGYSMKLGDYLGLHVSKLLSAEPFVLWSVRRSIEKDLPKREVWYEFDGHGVEVICDEDDNIRTIFLHSGVDDALWVIPFKLRRGEVVERFGAPSKSGVELRHPILGESGAWDRFIIGNLTIHVQYRLGSESIEMITLMRPDAVP